MAAETVVLNMADATGAVISSLVPLSADSPRAVLVLAQLLTIDATGGAIVRVRITNASAGTLRGTPAGGDPSEPVRIRPGGAFEVTIADHVGFSGMQLIAGDAVATTLTLTVSKLASRQHLLAQAVVSG